MLIFYIVLTVYILSVNFYAFRLVKMQRDDWEDGKRSSGGDGKLLLTALLGGATGVYISMFAMKYRVTNVVLMVLMPLFAVLNCYCFFLAFRGIYTLL